VGSQSALIGGSFLTDTGQSVRNRSVSPEAMRVVSRHGGSGVSGQRPSVRVRQPGLGMRILRAPLVAKIAGANTIIVLVAMLVSFIGGEAALGQGHFIILLATALVLSLIVNVALVVIALRPLDALEETATRIHDGDLGSRVPESALADSNIRRIGQTLNALVDGLTTDRERMRVMAKQVIKAGDRERAHIARELHDSTAQTLAALMLELSVLASENTNPRLHERLDRVRKIVGDVLDEVKMLAHTVHPRVLDDLGLHAALRLLARETELRGSVRVEMEGESTTDALNPTISSALYRVAQEAVGNALRHARSSAIAIRLAVTNGTAQLVVEDDGAGFDVADAEARRPGMGLFTMRERAELLGGSLLIDSVRGRGTRVVATVPTVEPALAVS